MNISKFTQKSVEAIQNCEKVAAEYGNQEIDQEHLIYSLITLDDSLIIKLIEKMEIQPEHFSDTVRELSKQEHALADAIKTMLGINPRVHLVAPKSITRSEGKAVRVIDKRKLHD